jgi:DNA-binding NtrC family response regulator
MPAYLVVDDSRPIRIALASALRSVSGPGAQVDDAATHGEAAERFHAREYDTVFLDMMLADGASSVPLLRRMLEQRPQARVILTTGLDREHPEVVAAISDGAFGYLRKPVRAESVRDALGQIDVESGRSVRIR